MKAIKRNQMMNWLSKHQQFVDKLYKTCVSNLYYLSLQRIKLN